MSKIEDPSGIPQDDLEREGLIDRLSQYLSVQPDAWHMRYNLGLALAHHGRQEEALQQFHEVLKYAPRHMESLVNIGGIHLARGEAPEAMAAFTKALVVWDVPVVRANLAVAYLQLDRLEEAVRELKRALEMNPEMPHVWTNLGSAYLRQGLLTESEEASRKALDIQPDFAMAHNNLAVVLLEQGRQEEAREHAARARELDYPVHPELLDSLGLA